MARKGAITREPGSKLLQRLSPGVYRTTNGGLANSQGRPIQRQAPQQNPWAPEQQAGSQQSPWSNMTPGVPRGDNMEVYPGQDNPIFDVGNRAIELARTKPSMEAIYMRPLTANSPIIQMPQFPQMPQASANHGGQYRLSPGVYGSKEQAMREYQNQMNRMRQMSRTPERLKGY